MAAQAGAEETGKGKAPCTGESEERSGRALRKERGSGAVQPGEKGNRGGQGAVHRGDNGKRGRCSREAGEEEGAVHREAGPVHRGERRPVHGEAEGSRGPGTGGKPGPEPRGSKRTERWGKGPEHRREEGPSSGENNERCRGHRGRAQDGAGSPGAPGKWGDRALGY